VFAGKPVNIERILSGWLVEHEAQGTQGAGLCGPEWVGIVQAFISNTSR